jgi:phenylacetate-CoA ligase
VTAVEADRRYFDEEAETRSRADIEAMQLERLSFMLPHAYEHSALVRAVWEEAGVHPRDIRSLDDFAERAPFIDKETLRHWREVRGDPYAGLLCVPPDQVTTILSSSGTTGEPTLSPQHWGAPAGAVPAGLSRDLWMMGLRPRDHVMMVIFTFRGPAFGMMQQFGATPVLCDYDPDDMVRLCELSLEFRPTGLYSLSSMIVLAIAEACERGGFDPRDVFASYRMLVHAGEPLGARAGAVVRSWGVPVFEHTSVGDVGTAFECPEHDGLHFWEDDTLAESLRPDGTEPVGDGVRGELVATALVNTTTPLIRYRSDDIVRLTRVPCPCGRTHARLWPVGRKGDGVEVEGRTILPVDLWAAVESVGECSRGLFQIVRTAPQMDRLVLRVGYAPGGTDRLDGVRDDVMGAVAGLVGLVPEVELVPEAELLRLGPPHKIPRAVERDR